MIPVPSIPVWFACGALTHVNSYLERRRMWRMELDSIMRDPVMVAILSERDVIDVRSVKPWGPYAFYEGPCSPRQAYKLLRDSA